MQNGEFKISITNLTKRFGDRLILDRINLTIPSGQTVALIGPSGGGKSTLLRCLNGLTPFDDGDIRVGRTRYDPTERQTAATPSCNNSGDCLAWSFKIFSCFPTCPQ
jgi:polar amino acid transport system ATP-binding protein